MSFLWRKKHVYFYLISQTLYTLKVHTDLGKRESSYIQSGKKQQQQTNEKKNSNSRSSNYGFDLNCYLPQELKPTKKTSTQKGNGILKTFIQCFFLF